MWCWRGFGGGGILIVCWDRKVNYKIFHYLMDIPIIFTLIVFILHLKK